MAGLQGTQETGHDQRPSVGGSQEGVQDGAERPQDLCQGLGDGGQQERRDGEREPLNISQSLSVGPCGGVQQQTQEGVGGSQGFCQSLAVDLGPGGQQETQYFRQRTQALCQALFVGPDVGGEQEDRVEGSRDLYQGVSVDQGAGVQQGPDEKLDFHLGMVALFIIAQYISNFYFSQIFFSMGCLCFPKKPRLNTAMVKEL